MYLDWKSRVLGFAGAVGLALGAALAGASAAQAEACRLVRLVSFDIAPRPDREIVIPVSVNGTTRPFGVETSGAISYVSDGLARALDLDIRASSVTNYRSDGERLNRYVVIDKLGIGPTTATRAHMLVDSGPDQTDPAGPPAGHLGPDYLRNFDLDFDFAAHKLSLFSPDHCKGKVVYWARAYATVPFTLNADGHIEFPVTLDGQKMPAMIATGSLRTVITGHQAARYFDLNSASSGVEPSPAGSEDADLDSLFLSLQDAGLRRRGRQRGRAQSAHRRHAGQYAAGLQQE